MPCSGDSKEIAKAVAEELDIDLYFAEVLPERKDEKVIELQKQGKKVAMVGDGVNDAPAQIGADVGIAIGSGTDIAIESAGIILVKSNPLAAGVLAGEGILLSAAVGALLMSLSTVIVAINAQLLRRTSLSQ